MIDLHTHSNHSDGTLSPEELLKEAEEKGIKALALTDHDTASGVRALNNSSFKFEFVPGIELSLQYNGTLRVHMLGLFIDAESPEVLRIENLNKILREERNLNILENLKNLNYDINYEEVKREAKVTVGRMHFALALVKKGYFKDTEEAISKLLRPGKPAFVERKRLGYEEGLESIRKMKGISILAHIGKEIKDYAEIEEVLQNMKDKGLDGLEVFHSDHDKAMTEILEDFSKKYDFLVSGGSDFHGFNKKVVKIGEGRGNLNIPFKVYIKLKNYWEKKFNL